MSSSAFSGCTIYPLPHKSQIADTFGPAAVASCFKPNSRRFVLLIGPYRYMPTWREKVVFIQYRRAGPLGSQLSTERIAMDIVFVNVMVGGHFNLNF